MTASSSWSDRHPAAATTAGLFTLTLMAMMLSVHPVAAMSMLGGAAVVGVVWLVDRERDRRAAAGARADAANRELMRALNTGRPIRLAPMSSQLTPARPPSRHVMNRWPTTPLATKPIREKVI